VSSITRLADAMKPDHILEHYLPMVQRLAKGDWFTSRTSACGLFAPVYGRLPAPVRAECRALWVPFFYIYCGTRWGSMACLVACLVYFFNTCLFIN
jgi:hypothetical protein